MAAVWFWKSGCRNNPTVPRTQTRTNIQRNSLSTTMATYFQSSMTWKKKPIKDISDLSYSFGLPHANVEFLLIKGNKSQGSGNKLTLGLVRDFSPTTLLSSGEKYSKYFLAFLDTSDTECGCLVWCQPRRTHSIIQLGIFFSLILVCKCY